eukprot:CAMPEP_0202961288 /NCGR_PEP_ID=MMETSP1396-20130829/5336_1 /ASSEMBLY_ACC=CAM_ASM_000872 /TAXON_ID= /ORGANISM="Pseudokeronopsis sp., Strain Brazil" /LENGTH=92 /DNA_ID=CAMNT_0049680987 /DNA_START=577 /DNA_END=855 /DNA_ORIENTATION=-
MKEYEDQTMNMKAFSRFLEEAPACTFADEDELLVEGEFDDQVGVFRCKFSRMVETMLDVEESGLIGEIESRSRVNFIVPRSSKESQVTFNPK